jgi:hypothetical protein
MKKLAAQIKRCITYIFAVGNPVKLPDMNKTGFTFIPWSRTHFVCHARHVPGGFGQNYQTMNENRGEITDCAKTEQSFLENR